MNRYPRIYSICRGCNEIIMAEQEPFGNRGYTGTWIHIRVTDWVIDEQDDPHPATPAVRDAARLIQAMA